LQGRAILPRFQYFRDLHRASSRNGIESNFCRAACREAERRDAYAQQVEFAPLRTALGYRSAV
jgi:hypothetical protein